MAKNYTEILELVNAGNQMGLSNTIKRDYGIPLDFTSVQPSLAAAIEYAATNTKAYVGQPLSVGSKLYIITDSVQPAFEGVTTEYDNYLAEVGSKTEGDGATIDLEDGVLMLHGFDLETTVAGMLPQVEVVDGVKRIKWVAISSIVEGDGNKITTLASEDGSVEITKKTDTDESLVYDLKVVHPAAPEYAIKKDERAEGATETKYHLTKDGTNVDVEIVVPDAYNDAALANRVKDLEDNTAGYQTANDVATTLADYATTQNLTDGLATKADKSAYDQTVIDLDALEARVDAFLSGSGAEGALDSLQELIEYINTHDDADISGILSSIQALESKLVLGTHEVDGEMQEYATVKAYVEAVIEALNVAQYAKASDLEGVEDRVAALEAKPFDTYAVKSEVEATYETKAHAEETYETKAYAGETYATKTELGEAVEGIEGDLETINGELVKKIETGTIAHSTEELAEGVTVNGTEMNIVVDAFTKAETRQYVADTIKTMTGGESAADVKLLLENHIAEYTEKVGQIDAKDAAQDTETAAIRSIAEGAATQANTNKTDIATHLGRIETLETAKGEHAAKIGTIEGKITALEGQDTIINNTIGEIQGNITALQGEDARLTGLINANSGEIAKKADADKVYTIEAANKAIEDAIAAIKPIDLTPYAKTEDVAKTYATIESVEAIYKAGEGEDAATGILADEIARATAAEKALSESLALLIENPTEDLDSVKDIIAHGKEHGTAVEGIITRLDGHDDILAGIGGENQPATVIDAIANAVNNLEPLAIATADKLGGVKSAAYVVEGDVTKVAVNAVYVDGTTGVGSVKAVSTDTLVNGTEELILIGGNATA